MPYFIRSKTSHAYTRRNNCEEVCTRWGSVIKPLLLQQHRFFCRLQISALDALYICFFQCSKLSLTRKRIIELIIMMLLVFFFLLHCERIKESRWIHDRCMALYYIVMSVQISVQNAPFSRFFYSAACRSVPDPGLTQQIIWSVGWCHCVLCSVQEPSLCPTHFYNMKWCIGSDKKKSNLISVGRLKPVAHSLHTPTEYLISMLDFHTNTNQPQCFPDTH